MIKCPNCSAELKFKVEDEKIICDYCGSIFSPTELRTKIQVSGEIEEKNKEEVIDPNNCFEGKSYTCSQCGANLLAFDETAITFCSYCGSQAMIESKMIKINNPDYIIPFKKTKEECINNYKKKLKHSFFAPNYMKSDIVVSKFRGIYLPYGIYKLKNDGKFSNAGKKYNHRSGDYVYYDDYNIVADTDTEYDGISFDLLSIYYDKYSFSLPFDYKECEEFNPNYLAGYYADTKDVTAETYDKEAKEIIGKDCNRIIKKNKKYKKYGCKNPKMPLIVDSRKIGMFPVYFLAIRDKKEEHVNYAVINGQTGKVAASLPLDFKKYLLVTILLSVLFYFIIDKTGVLFLPKTIVIFSIIASLISMMVSNNQLNKLAINREHYDDLGYMSDKNIDDYRFAKWIMKERKAPGNLCYAIISASLAYFSFLLILIKPALTFLSVFFLFSYEILFFLTIYYIFQFLKTLIQEKGTIKKANSLIPIKEKITKYLYKQIIAIIMGIIVLISNPVNDMYYYATALLSFIIIIISIYDIFREHNEIVSNKLPQLEIRGGDEHE